MDNDPKLPAKPTQEFLKGKKWPSQSRDLFSVTEDKTESRKTHKQAASEGRRRKGVAEETQDLLTFMGSRLYPTIKNNPCI